MMTADTEQPEFRRSEAFAEDVFDLVAPTPGIVAPSEAAGRSVMSLRGVLALVGVALPRRRQEAGGGRPGLARATFT